MSVQFHGNKDEVVAFVERMMARNDDTGDSGEGGVTDEPVERLGDEGQGGRTPAA